MRAASHSRIFSQEQDLYSVGVTAILTAATILTCGAAAPLMVAVATVTVTAGAVTVVNGASEVVEGLTSTSENSNDGYNFMRDTVMGGNADAYEAQRDFFAGVAEVGTAICGSYYAANGGNVCFVAGTLVLTDDGQIPIEDIEVGDYVYATDPETGESGYKRVAQTFKRETDELVHVTYSGGTITTTPTHPFYVAQKGWTAAIELRAGDMLVTVNGEYVIVEKIQHELLETPVSVYNFEVEDYHTYYVGVTSVLVHNKCVAKRGSYRADVRMGGEAGHPLGHAHIFNGSDRIASVSETGKLIAGTLDKGAKKFVRDFLPMIAEGIRRYYYLGD